MAHPVTTVARLARLTAESPSDAALLDRYRAGDAAALEPIVRRHGPAVLGVCRRALGPTADADDAFQATFLTLTLRANSIRRGDALAAWLHGVALRCCRKVQGRRLAVPLPDPAANADPYADVTWRELRSLLDEELNRLPPKLRAPLVLCHLESRTRDEAANYLGWSVRTLDRRLARGREVLKARLARRGVGPLGLGLAVLSTDGLAASVPDSLIALVCRSREAPAAIRALVPPAAGGAALKLVLGTFLLFGGLAALSGLGGPDREKPVAKPVAKVETAADLEEPLPPGAIRRFGSVRYRFPDSVAHSALSPDGKLVAVGGNQLVMVFDVATGRPVHTFRDCGMTSFVGRLPALAFSPDGQHLAHIVRDGPAAARVWDLGTGKEVCAVTGLRPDAVNPRIEPDLFHGLYYAEGGKRLVVVGMKRIHVRDAATGESVARHDLPKIAKVTPGPPANKVLTEADIVACSPDGDRYLTPDGKFWRVVTTATRTQLGRQPFDGLTGEPCAAFRPDGDAVAIRTADRKAVEVWDFTGGRITPPLLPVDRSVRFLGPLQFSSDGSTLFASADKAVYRWDVATGKGLPPLTGHVGNYVPVAHEAGGTLITVNGDGLVRRWHPKTGRALATPPGYSAHARIALSPDGRLAAVGDGSGRLDLWPVAGAQPRELLAAGSEVLQVRFSPDGKALAAGFASGEVRIWDVASGTESRRFVGGLKGSGERLDALAWTPDGTGLFVAGAAVGLRRWDLTTMTPRWTKEIREVQSMDASPDGRSLALVINRRSEVVIVDQATGDGQKVIKLGPPAITGWRLTRAVFTPDSRSLLTADHEGAVRVWVVSTGKVQVRLAGHDDVVWDLSVSNDGRFAATASADGTARVWELATGREVCRRAEPRTPIYHVCFAPDGRGLLTASRRGATLWSLRATGPGDREQLWAALAGDPATAYQAQWTLSQAEGIVPFLRDKIGPAVPPADEKRVGDLIRDLDSPTFKRREAAAEELGRLGRSAEPALRAAARRPASTEQQQRLEGLLAPFDRGPSPDELRTARAVQAVGWCPDPSVNGLLEAWAAGAEAAPLTQAAKAALRARTPGKQPATHFRRND
jgi:RNA polymerase sigma factor (sigma-70 family)